MTVHARTGDFIIIFNRGYIVEEQPDGATIYDMNSQFGYAFVNQEFKLPYTYYELYFVPRDSSAETSDVIKSDIEKPRGGEWVVIDINDYDHRINPNNVAGRYYLTMVATNEQQDFERTGYIEVNYEPINMKINIDDKINPEFIVVDTDNEETEILWTLYPKGTPNNVLFQGEGSITDRDVLDKLSDGNYTITHNATTKSIYGNPIRSRESTDFTIDRSIKKGTLTVNYVDDQNNELGVSKTFRKSEGTSQTIDVVPFQDYDYLGEKDDQSLDIVYSEGHQSRTLVYKLKESQLTVAYQDEFGLAIREPDTFKQTIHAHKRVEVPEIQGYEYSGELNNLGLEVVFTEADQQLTLVYIKKQNEEPLLPDNTENDDGTSVDPKDLNDVEQHHLNNMMAPNTGIKANYKSYGVIVLLSLLIIKITRKKTVSDY